MNKNVTTAYEQPVNDDGNVLVADFTAQKTNDVVQNITVSVNTIPGYQTNKDKVITAFDEFLKVIQSENVQTPDETVPIVSESDTNITSDSTSDSTSALSQ
ncbi:hypothetical protein CRI85_05860 [Leuconostoc pseudomesenteroides]|uniref:hypothetical protein n=1 Tax=Leuconostoc pseudomesenteroides TaxID=33968 RepID=UPI001E4EEA4A|nr:hypothetical protein [Leuconostoc pseudomesenteroides]MCC8439858.1 hypothetical protein [Leuconostoc pseudomesenteroides]